MTQAELKKQIFLIMVWYQSMFSNNKRQLLHVAVTNGAVTWIGFGVVFGICILDLCLWEDYYLLADWFELTFHLLSLQAAWLTFLTSCWLYSTFISEADFSFAISQLLCHVNNISALRPFSLTCTSAACRGYGGHARTRRDRISVNQSLTSHLTHRLVDTVIPSCAHWITSFRPPKKSEHSRASVRTTETGKVEPGQKDIKARKGFSFPGQDIFFSTVLSEDIWLGINSLCGRQMWVFHTAAVLAVWEVEAVYKGGV